MEHQTEKFHDNNELCAMDMTLASEEQQKAWLTMIIANELARGEERDEQLICECTEHLALLSPDIVMSEKECEAHLRAFLSAVQRNNRIAPSALSRFLSDRRTSRRHRLLYRIAAVASILLMIIALSPQAYALAILQRDTRQEEAAIQAEIMHTEQAYLAAISGQEAYAQPFQATYETLSDFFRAHSQLNFHYPNQLPKIQEISSIRITYFSEDCWLVIFTFRDPSIRYYTVQHMPHPTDPIDVEGDALRLTVDGREYVTIQEKGSKNGIYQTRCHDGNLSYTLITDSYDTTCDVLSLTGARVYRYDSMEKLQNDWAHLQSFDWPAQLPPGFRADNVTLHYDTQASWQIVVQLKYDNGNRTTANHAITISPVGNGIAHDLGIGAEMLSNETNKVYISYSGQAGSTGLCRAECIVDDIRYTVKILGYDPFMVFLNDFFGPF